MKPPSDLLTVTFLIVFSIASGLAIQEDGSSVFGIRPRGKIDDFNGIISKRAGSGNTRGNGLPNRSRSGPSAPRSGGASIQPQAEQSQGAQQRRVSSTGAQSQGSSGYPSSQRPPGNSPHTDTATSSRRVFNEANPPDAGHFAGPSGRAPADRPHSVPNRPLNSPLGVGVRQRFSVPVPAPNLPLGRGQAGRDPGRIFPSPPPPVLPPPPPPVLPPQRALPAFHPPVAPLQPAIPAFQPAAIQPPLPQLGPGFYPQVPPPGLPPVPGPFNPAPDNPSPARPVPSSSNGSAQTKATNSNNSKQKRSFDVDEVYSVLKSRNLQTRASGPKVTKSNGAKTNSGGGSPAMSKGTLVAPGSNSPPESARQLQQPPGPPIAAGGPALGRDPAVKTKTNTITDSRDPKKPRVDGSQGSPGQLSSPSNNGNRLAGADPNRNNRPAIENRVQPQQIGPGSSDTQGSVRRTPNQFPSSVPQAETLNRLLAQAHAERVRQGGIRPPQGAPGTGRGYGNPASDPGYNQRPQLLGQGRGGLAGPTGLAGPVTGQAGSPNRGVGRGMRTAADARAAVGNHNWGASFDDVPNSNNVRGSPTGNRFGRGAVGSSANSVSKSGSGGNLSSTGSVA